MSGPTTAIVTGDPLTALLSAAAIRAAEAIAAGYAEAEHLKAEHAAGRQARQAAQEAAQAQGTAALAAEAELAEAELTRLREAAARLTQSATQAAPQPASLPARPAEPAALAAYVRSVQALCAEMRAILLTEAARAQEEAGDGPRDIAIPAAAHAASAAPTGDTPDSPATLAQRLLSRIAHLGPPPADLAELARELAATPPGERAELLATELRRRLQAHLEALRGRMVEEATATIVEHSLKELGYEVEEVAHTLFVEGGVVHFRKPGWGDYMVRMRVDAQASTANFNVVRAVDAGDNETSVLDHIAEDRWCAEFPALLRTLAAYGVDLNVTRRLQAGELPVQRVARDKLPRFADEETARPAAAPLAREIK